MNYCEAAICLATILGSIYVYGSDHQQAMTQPDQRSTLSNLSKADYARGELREKDVITRLSPRLTNELNALGLTPGSAVFLRIFKESRELELWMLHKASGKYRHFRTWRIAAMSGHLGPKLAEGDFQAPEGFYHFGRSSMKPDSRYHLAFNLGFPNVYDRTHQRSGSFIMVHGNRVSAGCFAMTDPSIEEIYTLCHLALTNGQAAIRVHIFPFKMSAERLAGESKHRWHDFWTNLKQGHDWFASHGTPPEVSVSQKRYLFK